MRNEGIKSMVDKIKEKFFVMLIYPCDNALLPVFVWL